MPSSRQSEFYWTKWLEFWQWNESFCGCVAPPPPKKKWRMLLSPCWRRLSGHQCITLTCYYSLSSRKPDFRAWHCYWGPGWEGLRRKVKTQVRETWILNECGWTLVRGPWMHPKKKRACHQPRMLSFTMQDFRRVTCLPIAEPDAGGCPVWMSDAAWTANRI